MAVIVSFDELLQQLSEHAIQVDAQQVWPGQQFEWLAAAGVLNWLIPEQYGGTDISEREMTIAYEKLATACLATCFALTQRNGACQRIAGSTNEHLKADLLPQLARGDKFATVGISHLTTSRQHVQQPMVRVEQRDEQLILNGMIPWVTGACAADVIVTGGTLADGHQVLMAMPTDVPGISIQPKAELLALTAAETTSIDLKDVRLSSDALLAGPVENVMSQGKGGGAGSLTTSTLALGVAARSLKLLEDEVQRRPELTEKVTAFRDDIESLRNDIQAGCEKKTSDPAQPSAAAIRQRSNSLALRITQAALAVTKGAGFVKGHPAELAVREAMFFLVWSCPQPVVDGVLNELVCRDALMQLR